MKSYQTWIKDATKLLNKHPVAKGIGIMAGTSALGMGALESISHNAQKHKNSRTWRPLHDVTAY